MVALPNEIAFDSLGDGFRLILNYGDRSTDDATTFRRAAWRNGFRPVPVRTAEKAPFGPDWRNVALDHLPPCLHMDASANPAASNTGILCDGLRVIDIDVEDAEIVDRIEALARDLLGDTLTRFRNNSPRLALVYRAADGAPPKFSVKGHFGQIEVLGNGQQVVAHGVHPSGSEYQWRGGSPATVRREDIPAVSEEDVQHFLADAKRLLGAVPVSSAPADAPRVAASPQSSSPLPTTIAMPALRDHPLVRAYVNAGVADELKLLATQTEPGRNSRLNRAAFAIAQFVAADLYPEGQALAELEQAALACGIWQDDGPLQCRKTINSGFNKGMKELRPIPASILQAIEDEQRGEELQRTLIINEDGSRTDMATGEVFEPPAPLDIIGGRDFPDHLTRVPGLVGRIVDWIEASARRPSRAMALGAAVGIVGTAMGRYAAGPTMAGTHLYTLALAKTGAGKDHPMQQIRRALNAAGMQRCLGAEEFQSSPSVINMAINKPLCICTMDEFGAFLARINSRRAGGFEMGITKSLRSLWGTNYGIFLTPEWAAKESKPIYAPHIGIYAASTHEEFFAALDSKQAVNGFLNRFLLISSEREAPEVDEPELPAQVVPEDIIEGLKARFGGGNANYANTASVVSDVEIIPRVIPWANDGVQAIYKALVREIERIGDRHPDAVPYLARTAEMAVRLATIRAGGINALMPVVTVADMEWGRDVALHSAESMAIMAGKYVADTEAQADAKRIIRLLEEAGGRIKKRDLLRRLQHRMKNRDLKDLLEAMKASETVRIEFERPSSGGHTAEVVVLATDLD